MGKWDDDQRKAEQEYQLGKSGQNIPTQSGQKGHEEWKDLQKPNPYDPNKSSGCYITTACCEYAGLPDDCKELEILRAFRDRFMANKPRGAAELEEYYTTAPKIIEKINSNAIPHEVYETILDKVRKSVALIEEGKDEEAYEFYKACVLDLKDKYLK